MADAATATEEVEVSNDDKAFETGLGGSTTQVEAETTEEEGKEEGDEPETEAEDTEEGDGEPKPAEEDEPEKTDDAGDEESPKPEAKQARRGYAERQALKQAATTVVDQLAPAQTKESLVENKGMDPLEAEVEAMRLDMQRREAVQQLTELNSGIQADADNVLRDFPVFDEKAPGFNKELTEATMSMWQEAAHYQAAKENPSVVTRADVPLYKFYAHVADAYERGLAAGEAKGKTAGQKAAEQELASTEVAPGVTKTEAVVPNEDALFLKGLKGT